MEHTHDQGESRPVNDAAPSSHGAGVNARSSHADHTRTDWKRVTAKRLCELCGRDSYCYYTEDRAVLCTKITEVPLGWRHVCFVPNAEGHVFRPDDEAPPTTAKRRTPKPPKSGGGAAKPEVLETINDGPPTMYPYVDEQGELLFEVVRRPVIKHFADGTKRPDKTFTQRRPNPDGGWIYSLGETRRVLYRLPELIASPHDRDVYIVEGEKDADRLIGLGLVATTNPQGAKKWKLLDPACLEELRGRRIIIVPDNDDDGREHAQQVAASLHLIAACVHMLELPDLPEKGDVSDWLNADGTLEELLSLAAGTERWTPDGQSDPEAAGPIGPVLLNMADVTPEPVRWLWFGRIPLGKITVIAGHPGLGKSFLTTDIAARVTTGSEWPDGSGFALSGSVIIASAEDDPNDTIRPRLDAAGAAVVRINVLDGFRTIAGGPIRPFTLQDVGTLKESIAATPGCVLVVVDPIGAYYGNIEAHRNEQVRALLAPLATLARDTGVALVLVTHLNKSPGSHAVSRMTGSLALPAAARSAWLVAPDRDDPDARVFVPAKNNLAKRASGLRYRIDGEPARVVWSPDPINLTADEALAHVPTDEETRSAVDDAADFLCMILKGGPRPAKEVFASGDNAGISAATLRRAKDKLGVRSERDGPTGWEWVLPTKMLGAGGPQILSTLHSFEHLGSDESHSDGEDAQGDQDAQGDTAPPESIFGTDDDRHRPNWWESGA